MTSFGLWGLIPPVLAIILAFITKDVIVSLFLGILSATLIVSGGNPFLALMQLSDVLANNLADGWNIRIFLFCTLLGGLVGMLSKTGAAHAFGSWASSKIKTSRASQLMTFVFGLIISIDDYFNSLTVGTVMRPLSDSTKVSRAKLAYILDSTAAPVCIIAPISSWVVTVMSIVKASDGFADLGISPFEFFVRSIPYNLYAIGTLIFVLLIILSQRDFGPMKVSEKLAKSDKLFNEEKYGPAAGNVENISNNKVRPFDMIFPIALLIISSLIFFPLVTWINAVNGESLGSFKEAFNSITLIDAFKESDASLALFYSIIFTVFLTYIYYLLRGLFTLETAANALMEGIKSMIPALMILVMAWTIGSIIKSSPSEGGLGSGTYLAELVVKGRFPLAIIPLIVFILSALISFATGTSWGTFGIMIPLLMPITTGLAEAYGLEQENLLNISMICISAVIGGAVFGDHTSPISDTTILSSTGASCPHLEHVATQMPYAIFVAFATALGFIVAGFSMSLLATWLTVLLSLIAGLIFLPKFF